MSIKKIIVNGELCWSYDVMINGHRLRKASKKWSRKQAAEEERLAILNYGQSEKITFGELANIYFKHKKAEIKESSYRRLFNSCKNHILPFFSEMVVNDLTNKDIERWQNELLGKTFKGKLYSNNTIADTQTLLRSILEWGYIYNYTARNPFKSKNVHRKTEFKKEMVCWSKEQFDEFIQNVDDPLYNAVFRLLFCGGLRKGEMMALNIEDYDGKGVTVSKTYDEHNHVTTPPKTSNSYRYVSLNKATCSAIDELIATYPKTKDFGKQPLFGFYRHLSSTSLDRARDKYLALTDLPYITIHGFRHSCCSHLLQQGYRAKEVSDYLGNTEEMVTRTYSHLIQNRKAEMAATFE